MTRFSLALVGLLAMPAAASAAYVTLAPNGVLSNCSGSVGGTAAAVAFPSAGTGPSAPTWYLLIQNTSASNDLWIDPLPGGTATTGEPSYELFPGAAFLFTGTDVMPSTISAIGSASSTTYACWYK